MILKYTQNGTDCFKQVVEVAVYADCLVFSVMGDPRADPYRKIPRKLLRGRIAIMADNGDSLMEYG